MSQPASHASPAAPAPLPADDIIVLENVTWADYPRLLELRGERPVPRLTYVKGVLELTTPSRPHESIKSTIGRLVEAWCFEHDVAISPYGSWTHESKDAERGVEPDECHVLGDVAQPERCDLAIEVVWSAAASTSSTPISRWASGKSGSGRAGGSRSSAFATPDTFGCQEARCSPASTSRSSPATSISSPRAVTEYRAALRARG